MTLVKILIVALLPQGLLSGSEMCPYWKDILRSPGFAEHVLQVTNMTDLHVGLPPEFGEEDNRLFAEFLKATPISLRIFTHEEGLCNEEICEVSSTELHAVLLVVCRKTVWMEIVLEKFSSYYLYLHGARDKRVVRSVRSNAVIKYLFSSLLVLRRILRRGCGRRHILKTE
ncbi:hypothetical protein HPB47_007964 [Ixodes persulcatus]|uniref:Uncharacterized protein n=1 Tax=Ixodes persulcatus TaxID=34615 RepID=A0AC60P6E7_IXOPE|nr:hypothetical protein HPB47_007964 [Ixodes persulcatus]